MRLWTVKAAYLIERLDFGVHDERKLAQFARVGLGGGEPLLQTRLVDIFEAARAVAGRQQRIPGFALAMANTANVSAVLRRLTAARTESGRERPVMIRLELILALVSFLPKINKNNYKVNDRTFVCRP